MYQTIRWKSIEIFRRDALQDASRSAGLPLVATLFSSDVLSSPLLPNFEQSVAEVFS
ncbi:hypothetical protein TUMEXPCC7403_15320 [Tumidithrix helvetica PCC 7403]|uniref:hypothetical protein n=1 Tax=Tumidithrix helvetica TaxID=3457545 RepID=UPI003CAF1E54